MGGRGSSSRRGGGGNFHSFSDVPIPHAGVLGISTIEYDGPDTEQRAFFGAHSNYDEIIQGMSSDERDAFRAWSSGIFMGGQQYWGFSKMNSENQEWTRAYDKVLDQSVVTKGVEIVRLSDAKMLFGLGKDTATLEELQAMKGSIITSKGNLACSAAKEGLSIGRPIGSSSKSIEYKFKIPAGTKGAGMYIGDARLHGWGERQREWMMNRDVQFQVGKTEFNKGRGVYEVELTFIGRTAHDYS